MKRSALKWWDLLLLTLILFGPAIWSSAAASFAPAQEVLSQGTEFAAMDNFYAILTQSLQMALALSYLWMRKFDFSQWKYRITWKGTVFAVCLFLVLGFCMDLLTMLTQGWSWVPELLRDNIPVVSAFQGLDVLLILFSLLNGFYEEIFFLGMCTAVGETPKARRLSFVYSILVRISFHTYQGLTFALGIGLILGIVYYVLYRKYSENLYPYILSHTLGDIFGLSLLRFL